MPSSPYTHPTYSPNPWHLSPKSTPLSPSLQSYTHSTRPRYTPSPPSSPSLTTGDATYSLPTSPYPPPPSSSSSLSARSSHISRTTSHDRSTADPLDYMNARLSSSTTPSQHDISPSTLHAKSLELAALHALAKARLSRARTSFADGIAAARATRADLEWTSARMRRLNGRMVADRRFGQVYERVDGRVGRVVDDED